MLVQEYGKNYQLQGYLGVRHKDLLTKISFVSSVSLILCFGNLKCCGKLTNWWNRSQQSRVSNHHGHRVWSRWTKQTLYSDLSLLNSWFYRTEAKILGGTGNEIRAHQNLRAWQRTKTTTMPTRMAVGFSVRHLNGTALKWRWVEQIIGSWALV